MKSEKFIKEIIKAGESEQLEFKTSVRNDAIGKVVCSFLNGEGGQVLIGVDDNGEIVGINNAETISTQLQKYLTKEIVPEVPVSVSVEKYKDKEILSVKVWAGSKQPYVFDGGIFYRRDSNTVKASSKEISELIHKREQSQIR
jgi:ATP-dependent DNA helicase RecG